MRPFNNLFHKLIPVVFVYAGFSATAQDSTMQYFRNNDKRGINAFETTKKDQALLPA